MHCKLSGFFYCFGGGGPLGDLNKIGRFSNGEWSEMSGTLRMAREGHRVIVKSTKVTVIGGRVPVLD